MFWKILSGLVRTTVAVNKSVTALGLAIIITVSVYDHMQARKKRDEQRLR